MMWLSIAFPILRAGGGQRLGFEGDPLGLVELLDVGIDAFAHGLVARFLLVLAAAFLGVLTFPGLAGFLACLPLGTADKTLGAA